MIPVVDLGNSGERARHVDKLSNAFRVFPGRNQNEFDTLRECFVPLGQAFDSFVDGHRRYLNCNGSDRKHKAHRHDGF